MTLNEFKNYMKGYKDAFDGAPSDAECRKMLERMFELLESVRETSGITVYPDRLYPTQLPAITYGTPIVPCTPRNGEITC